MKKSKKSAMINRGRLLNFIAASIIVRALLAEAPTFLQLLRLFYLKLIRKDENLKERYGEWAVVTGASDGIGKSYCAQLAARGLNIVLIARNYEKLREVASKLQEDYKIQTKVIVADFSLGTEIYAHIQRELEDVDVGILVNNVGMQYYYPMPISEISEKEVWDNLNVNLASTVNMTRIVLPKILAKNKGAIVNMSSGASSLVQPYMLLYGCSKAYMTNFSEGLREELKRTNITVQTLVPFHIASRINHFQRRLLRESYLIPSTDSFVTEAIQALGRVDYTTGFNSHRVIWCHLQLLPYWCRTKLASLYYERLRYFYLKRNKKMVM